MDSLKKTRFKRNIFNIFALILMFGINLNIMAKNITFTEFNYPSGNNKLYSKVYQGNSNDGSDFYIEITSVKRTEKTITFNFDSSKELQENGSKVSYIKLNLDGNLYEMNLVQISNSNKIYQAIYTGDNISDIGKVSFELYLIHGNNLIGNKVNATPELIMSLNLYSPQKAFDQAGTFDGLLNTKNSEYEFWTSYNTEGKPNRVTNILDNLTKDELKEVLAEQFPNKDNSDKVDLFSRETDVIITGENEDIWITFLHEDAGYKNTLAYFTYKKGNKPSDASKVKDLTIVFPNSSVLDNGGDMLIGDKVYVGKFEKDTVISWVLLTNGFSTDTLKNNANNSNYPIELERSIKALQFSDEEMNIGGNKQMATYLYNDMLVLAFEDISRYVGGDKDFNDTFFFVEKTLGFDTEDYGHDYQEQLIVSYEGSSSITKDKDHRYYQELSYYPRGTDMNSFENAINFTEEADESWYESLVVYKDEDINPRILDYEGDDKNSIYLPVKKNKTDNLGEFYYSPNYSTAFNTTKDKYILPSQIKELNYDQVKKEISYNFQNSGHANFSNSKTIIRITKDKGKVYDVLNRKNPLETDLEKLETENGYVDFVFLDRDFLVSDLETVNNFVIKRVGESEDVKFKLQNIPNGSYTVQVYTIKYSADNFNTDDYVIVTFEDQIDIVYEATAPVINKFIIKNNTLKDLLDSLEDASGTGLFENADELSTSDILAGDTPVAKAGDELTVSLTLIDANFTLNEDGTIKVDANGIPVDINFNWDIFELQMDKTITVNYNSETGVLDIQFTVKVKDSLSGINGIRDLFDTEGITDAFGNKAEIAGDKVNLDNISPSAQDITIDISEESKTLYGRKAKVNWYITNKAEETEDFSYQLNITDNSNEEILTYIIVYSFKNGSNQWRIWNSSNMPMSVDISESKLTDGEYNVRVISIDKAGNISHGISNLTSSNLNTVLSSQNFNESDLKYHVYTDQGDLSVVINTEKIAPNEEEKLVVEFTVLSHYMGIDETHNEPYRLVPTAGDLEIKSNGTVLYSGSNLIGIPPNEQDPEGEHEYTKVFTAEITNTYLENEPFDKILEQSNVTVVAVGKIRTEKSEAVEKVINIYPELKVPELLSLIIKNKTVESLTNTLKTITGENISTSFYKENYNEEELKGSSIASTIYSKVGDTIEIDLTFRDESIPATNTAILEKSVAGISSTITSVVKSILLDDDQSDNEITVRFTFMIEDSALVDGSRQINFKITDEYSNERDLVFTFELDNNPVSDAIISSYSRPDTSDIESKTVNGETAKYINRYNGIDYTYQVNVAGGGNEAALYLLLMKTENPVNLNSEGNIYWGVIKGKATDNLADESFELPVDVRPVTEADYTGEYDTKYIIKRVAVIDKAGNLTKANGEKVSTISDIAGLIPETNTNDKLHHVDTVKPVIANVSITKLTSADFSAYKLNDSFKLKFDVLDDNLAPYVTQSGIIYYTVTVNSGNLSGLTIVLSDTDMLDNDTSNGVITFEKTVELKNIAGDIGEFEIVVTALDLAENSEQKNIGTVNYNNEIPAEIELIIKSDIESGSYPTELITAVQVEPLAKLIDNNLTVYGKSGNKTYTDVDVAYSNNLSTGLNTISSIMIYTDSGNQISADKITKVNGVDASVSNVKIYRDNLLGDGNSSYNPSRVARILVSYVRDNIYKLEFDFSSVRDISGIEKIIVHEIKIRGKRATDLTWSTEESGTYKNFDADEIFYNRNAGSSYGVYNFDQTKLSNLTSQDGFGPVVMYVDITNNQKFIGSRITFEIDIYDGVGNKWSTGNGKLQYDAFFPKQALEIKGRIEGSQREKISKIKVVGDGAGSKFEIQEVTEGGK